MGVARLIGSGKVYEDDFLNPTLDPRWEVLPNDPTRYELSGGNLVLKHGSPTLYMFFKPLTTLDEFVFDVKNSYNPDTEGCYGGVVVFIDEHNYMEIEEFFDTSLPTPLAKTYPWIRLVRSYNIYSAYWSDDGKVWNLLGTAELSGAPKVGLYLRGDGDRPMTVEYIRINKSTNVTFDNITVGTKVELLDENGIPVETKVCRAEQTAVEFNLDRFDFPFTGNFAVILPDGNRFESSDSIKINKGDLYYFEVAPDLYYKESDVNTGSFFDVLLYPNTERFLGYLTSGGTATQEVQMFAKNSMISGEFKNVIFELTSGTDKVQIAPDVGGLPGAYSSTITAFSILPGQSYKFWVRMAREESADRYASLVKFSLKMHSTYL